MAETLSGSLSTNNEESHGYGTLGLILSWTATQNIANNTSAIKWTVKSKGTMSSGYWYYCYGVEVTINGTKVLNTTSKFEMRGDGGYKKTGTITVAHAADGSKSVSMSVRAKIYDNNWNCTKSGSFDLKKINRYALLSSGTDFTNENYPSIVYTNPAGTALTTDLKARITWKDTNNQDQATSWVTLNDDGGEYTFNSSTLTSANITSMLNACPSANYLAVKFDLQSTMGGVEYHDYKDAVMNVVNANPTFTTAPSYEDANPSVVAITGSNQTIVQRQSKLRIYHGTAAAQKGASLVNYPYSLRFNGQLYGFIGNYIEFDKPDLAGTYQAEITATDKRGNNVTSTINIVILDWTEPTADCTLERQNSFEATCDLKVTAHISSLGGLNASHLSITEKHRIIDTSTWSDVSSVPDDTATTRSLANTDAWEMEISVSDAFATTPYRITVPKGIPFIYKDTYNNSVAINGIPDDQNQLYVGGTIKTTGKITAPSMSITDISSQFSISKTSGNWSINAITAYRMGNFVSLQLTFVGNGSAVNTGINAFVGTLTAGPLPVLAAKTVTFISSSCIVVQIDSAGNIYARVTAANCTLGSGTTNSATLTFLVND